MIIFKKESHLLFNKPTSFHIENSFNRYNLNQNSIIFAVWIIHVLSHKIEFQYKYKAWSKYSLCAATNKREVYVLESEGTRLDRILWIQTH